MLMYDVIMNQINTTASYLLSKPANQWGWEFICVKASTSTSVTWKITGHRDRFGVLSGVLFGVVYDLAEL